MKQLILVLSALFLTIPMYSQLDNAIVRTETIKPIKVKGNGLGDGTCEILRFTYVDGSTSAALVLVHNHLTMFEDINEIDELISLIDQVESFKHREAKAKIEDTEISLVLDGLSLVKDKKGAWKYINRKNEIPLWFKIKNIEKFREFLVVNNDFIKSL